MHAGEELREGAIEGEDGGKRKKKKIKLHIREEVCLTAGRGSESMKLIHVMCLKCNWNKNTNIMVYASNNRRNKIQAVH